MDKYFEPINKLYLLQSFTEKEDERKQEEAFHKELLLLGGNRLHRYREYQSGLH